VNQGHFLYSSKDKYAKRVTIIAIFVSIFGLAGIVGSVLTYVHQNNSNTKVNIAGRQRFLSAMILLDLQKLSTDNTNREVIDSINNRRYLFKEGMNILGISGPSVVQGLQESRFANEKTPDSVDLFSESMSFFNMTSPDLNDLEHRLPVIREKQRQTIGASWDIYTGNLARHFDNVSFKIMLFVVFCFSLVFGLAAYAIFLIVSVNSENKRNKFILKNSSKFVSLGEQTVNINHDMNNILAVISTFVSSFKNLIKDRSDLLQKFTVLEKSVDRLTALTSALRRSVVGQTNDEIVEEVKVYDVVEDCRTILSDKLKSHGVTFISEVKEDFTIQFRKDFLYQLLLNLISNSVDAVSEKENRWIKVLAEEEDHHIKISVVDSGEGLPLDVREKLFMPFFTTKTSGSGLGLSYLKRMAEEMNGQLLYDDGAINTCFVFTFLQAESFKSERNN